MLECCGLLFVTTLFWLKSHKFFTQFGEVHDSDNTLFVADWLSNCVG